MKKLHERTKRIVALELDDDQLRTILMSLSLTTPSERTSEARSFYKLETFEDVGDDLFDGLVSLLNMEETVHEATSPKASAYADSTFGYGSDSTLI